MKSRKLTLRLPRSGHALRLALRWAGDHSLFGLAEDEGRGEAIALLVEEGWLPEETAAVAAEVAHGFSDREEIAVEAGNHAAAHYRNVGGLGIEIAERWAREGPGAVRRYCAKG